MKDEVSHSRGCHGERGGLAYTARSAGYESCLVFEFRNWEF
jgi:hypothetical protein